MVSLSAGLRVFLRMRGAAGAVYGVPLQLQREATDLQRSCHLSSAMRTLTTLVVLTTLLAGGSCLICETCIGPGQGCTGLAQPCETHEDTCLTSIGMNSLGGSNNIETLKACVAAEDCYAGSISVTTNAGLHLESISSCCHDNLCNRQDLNLLPVNLTANGLECPVCFAFGSDHCEGTEFLSCTGEASYCITVSGTLRAGGLPSSFAARGCSTEIACTLPLKTALYTTGLVFNLDSMECSSALKARKG
nr:phospholipase A2 inhibitor and Ly6/PLAUR domain-containing protein-like [Anolis sagrei ordinatus]